MNTDEAWMKQALGEAAKGYPSPNPHVGAAIVKNERLLAIAHHDRAGEDHAEVAALKIAGPEARGATLYVSLEPCNHTGRTTPCTEAIVAAGVARVVVGCVDPNPHVPGGGAEQLRAAGIEVVFGPWDAAARKVIAPWTKFVTEGIPYVALKLALSLDGRIATRTGASRWVTGPESRARVHQLRTQHDAVAVGIGTALADNPRLTVRSVPGLSPVRLVFDTKLRLPAQSHLVQEAKDVATWALTGTDAPAASEEMLRSYGVDILRVSYTAEGRIDPFAALRQLAARGIVNMMIEGGAELAGSFLAGRLADELHAFLAPIMLGPRGRPGAVDWAGPDTLDRAPRIDHPTWELVGSDAHVFGPILYTDV